MINFKSKKNIIIISSTVVVVTLIISLFVINNKQTKIDIAFLNIDEPLIEGKYSTFLNDNKDLLNDTTNKEYTYDATKFIGNKQPTLENDNINTYTLNEGESFTVNVNVDKLGLYKINLSYYLLTDEYGSNEISVSVDDACQYDEARQITLQEEWVDDEEISLDRYGNDSLPEQIKQKTLLSYTLKDSSKLYDEGLYFKLKSGDNKITISSVQGDVKIASLKLIQESKLISYNDYFKGEVEDSTYVATYEAEDYISKNSSSIQKGTSSDVNVTPFSTYRNKLNVIGDSSFNEAGNRVDYKVEVLKEGYYYITVKALQTEKNTTSYRTIYINDKVPFLEAYQIPFSYNSTWQNVTLGALNGTPYAFYLNQGINKISFEVNVSKMRVINEKLSKLSTEMNQLGLEVTRVTGNSTDSEIDWDMSEHFPNIEQTFANWIKEINEILAYLKNANGYEGKSYLTSDISTALSNIEKLASDINKLPTRLTLLSSGSSCAAQYLSNQISSVTTSSVTLDKFYIHGSKAKLSKAKANGFKTMWVKTKRLLNSFVDQNYVSESKDALKVWTARSRQYCNVLQKMVDDDFTKKTGIKVDIELLADESKILLANAANEAPDVVTGVSTWIPNEYGMRGAILDLREFDDYKDVIKSYTNEQLIPLTYDDKLFGIPETENFYVLFYRKDILENLNLSVPNTWNDVIDMLPVLERFGMQFYIPLSSSASSKSYDSTAPFIWQFNGDLYNLDTLTSGVDNENTIQALQFMTDLYREYSLPYQVSSFFNYFRYSSMPIGIADYGTYLQLLNAATEISGLWGISVVPGVEINGQINRYMSGAQQASMIFNKTDKKDEAWEFVKWWSSKETQLTYSQKMINTYGKKYLWNTANMDAFKELSWDAHDKEVILEQWSYLKEVAKIPGSYIIEREISNIYNQVVFQDKNLRSTVSDSVIKMNKEIRRKMIEFGYMDEYGNKIKQYNYPSAESIEKWRQ